MKTLDPAFYGMAAWEWRLLREAGKSQQRKEVVQMAKQKPRPKKGGKKGGMKKPVD